MEPYHWRHLLRIILVDVLVEVGPLLLVGHSHGVLRLLLLLQNTTALSFLVLAEREIFPRVDRVVLPKVLLLEDLQLFLRQVEVKGRHGVEDGAVLFPLLRLVGASLQEGRGELLVALGLGDVAFAVEDRVVVGWFAVLLTVGAEVALVDLAVALAG